MNAGRTRNHFKDFSDLYIPRNYVELCSRRAIVMEYVEGIKINEVEELRKKFGNPVKASEILIDVFAKMIFVYGHVHCDAHPGNILIREHPEKKGKP